MNKDLFISEVVCQMSCVLDANQANKLKQVLITSLQNKCLIEEETRLVPVDSSNNSHIVDLYIAELYSDRHSESTIKQYRRAVLNLINTVQKNIADITKDDLMCYHISMQKKGLSDNTLINERRYLKVFFRWCQQNEIINKNPYDRIKNIVKQPPVKKTILSDAEIVRMKDVCTKPVELALVDFLLSTGVRVGELISLKLADVDWTTGVVSVYASKTSTERKVYLTAEALKHLTDYRNSLNPTKLNNSSLFVSRTYQPLSAEGAEYMLQKIAQSAHVNKHITVHVFRKTLATKLFRAGASTSVIQSILGHKNFATTSTYYCSIDAQDVRSEFLKLM